MNRGAVIGIVAVSVIVLGTAGTVFEITTNDNIRALLGMGESKIEENHASRISGDDYADKENDSFDLDSYNVTVGSPDANGDMYISDYITINGKKLSEFDDLNKLKFAIYDAYSDAGLTEADASQATINGDTLDFYDSTGNHMHCTGATTGDSSISFSYSFDIEDTSGALLKVVLMDSSLLSREGLSQFKGYYADKNLTINYKDGKWDTDGMPMLANWDTENQPMYVCTAVDEYETYGISISYEDMSKTQKHIDAAKASKCIGDYIVFGEQYFTKNMTPLKDVTCDNVVNLYEPKLEDGDWMFDWQSQTKEHGNTYYEASGNAYSDGDSLFLTRLQIVLDGSNQIQFIFDIPEGEEKIFGYSIDSYVLDEENIDEFDGYTDETGTYLCTYEKFESEESYTVKLTITHIFNSTEETEVGE